MLLGRRQFNNCSRPSTDHHRREDHRHRSQRTSFRPPTVERAPCGSQQLGVCGEVCGRRRCCRCVGPSWFAAGVFVAVLALTVDRVEPKLFSTQMSQRIVATRHGRLRGILITLPDQSLPSVEAYLGLEYASLLGGELRFMPPMFSPSTSWDGVRTALKFKPVCPQRLPDPDALQGHAPSHVVQRLRKILPFLEPQQEDCLHLNIYVPVQDRNSSELLPVVLFVHGESYETGTGNAYDGSVLSAFGRLIVVTFNYRLGVLGFLTTEDSHAPGNYALLDLVAALHWIADNIESFGGNPAAVTLFGHGVGGALVNLLMLSPITRGRSLYQRAIIHSGSALSSWAVAKDAMSQTESLADKLNCSAATSRPPPQSSSLSGVPKTLVSGAPGNMQLVQCLRRYSADQLVNAASTAAGQTTAKNDFVSSFGPTLGGSAGILPDRSVSALIETSCRDSDAVRWHSSAFGNTALLLGVTGVEGLGYVDSPSPARSGVRANSDLLQPLSNADDALWRQKLRVYVESVFRHHLQKIFDVVAHNYNDWQEDNNNNNDDEVETEDDEDSSQTDGVAATSGGSSTWMQRQRLRKLDQLAELISDGNFGAPIVRLAQFHSGCGRSAETAASGLPSSTYLYSVDGDRRTSKTGSSRRAAGLDQWPDFLAYLFGAPLAPGIDPFPAAPMFTEVDRKQSENIMMYWSNFIKTGNPNGDALPIGKQKTTQWPRYDINNQQYMSLGVPPTVRHHYKSHKMALWNDLIPRLHRPDMFDPAASQYAPRHPFDDSLNHVNNRPALPPPGGAATPSAVAIGRRPASPAAQRTTATLTNTAFPPPRQPHTATTTSRPRRFTVASRTSSDWAADLGDDANQGATALSAVNRPRAAVEGADEGGDYDVTMTSTFGLTVAVGGALLALNVVVFAATFCQWRKLVRSARSRKQVLVLEDGAAFQQLDGRQLTDRDLNGGHQSINNVDHKPEMEDSIRSDDAASPLPYTVLPNWATAADRKLTNNCNGPDRKSGGTATPLPLPASSTPVRHTPSPVVSSDVTPLRATPPNHCGPSSSQQQLYDVIVMSRTASSSVNDVSRTGHNNVENHRQTTSTVV